MNQLDKSINKLDSLVQQKRSSIGTPKVISAINDLLHIFRMLQDGVGHGKIVQIQMHIDKIKELMRS